MLSPVRSLAPVSRGSARRPTTLPVDLVAYWQLTETSGTRVNSVVGAAFPLTPYNSPGSVASIVPGIPGNGLLTSVDPQFVYAPSTWIPQSTTSRSISLWIKGFSTTVNRGIMSVGDNSLDTSPDWLIVQNSGMQIVVYHNAGYNLASPATTGGVTYHIVYIYNRPTQIATLYLNNVLVATHGPAGDFASKTSLFIASGYPASFLGGTQAVGVWNKALTSLEVSTLYNSGNGLDYPF